MTVRMHTPNLLARAGTVTALTLVTLGGTTVAPGETGNAEAATVSAYALRIAASRAVLPTSTAPKGRTASTVRA